MNEERPFPIEFVVILLIIAIANDLAEIFFDLLDFTGVGVAGEAIMEPMNFILDLFFTSIFWWRVGFGGSTVTQYIGDLLEPLLIPGRTISVGLGMWAANNPSSSIGKIATVASSLESGDIAGEVGGATEVAQGEVAEAGKKLQGKIGSGGEEGRGMGGEPEKAPSLDEEPHEEQGTKKKKEGPENDVFKNPYDNPLETAGEELNKPPEEEFHEGAGFGTKEEPQEADDQPRRVIDIATRRPPQPKEGESPDNTSAENHVKAA